MSRGCGERRGRGTIRRLRKRTMACLEPEVVPVIDVMGGAVVRAARGQRSRYQPLKSCWTPSSDPCDVARALRDRYGFRTLYVADLDAIQARHRGGRPAPDDRLLRRLTADGWAVWLDAGITGREEAERIAECGATPVVGLETLPSWSVLSDIVRCLGARMIFSVDLYRGRPVRVPAMQDAPSSSADHRAGPSPGDDRPTADAPGWRDVVFRAVAEGVRRFIVLDLYLVGSGEGPVAARYVGDPAFAQIGERVQRITGGGVRNWDDCRSLLAAGADTVLVASALHDGRMMPEAMPRGVRRDCGHS
ncbi:MAG: hypothetical protein D6725_07645 [Planctomycetota bacterium]|nr:MAG: hypothetical protein D6725_07645 [Planctomycetota bacterium]